MEEIADRYYKSYDLAGAAFAIYLANLGFRWSDKAAGLSQVKTVDQLLAIRKMQSYEFVHLAAYVAGRQAERRGLPLVDGSDIRQFTLPSQTWDRKRSIPRGKLVLGVPRTPVRWMKGEEATLIGIALGNGQVIALHRGRNLGVTHTETLFPSILFKEVRFGDYDWLASLEDPDGAIAARQAQKIRQLGSQEIQFSLAR